MFSHGYPKLTAMYDERQGGGFYDVKTELIYIAVSHRFRHLPFMLTLNSSLMSQQLLQSF